MDIVCGSDQLRNIPYILNGELYQIQVQEGDNVTVKCQNCPPERVYRGSVRSTGNFHMHIKRRHPDLLARLHEMKVRALLERRDRLMRNRKVGRRTSRSTSVKQQSPPLLKIKTVFQRHQLAAAAVQKNEPVNYCVAEKIPQRDLEKKANQRPNSNEAGTKNSVGSTNDCNEATSFAPSTIDVERQGDSITCSSPISSCGSTIVNTVGTTLVALVKNENLLMPAQAMDLSTNSSVACTSPPSISSLSSGIGCDEGSLHLGTTQQNGNCKCSELLQQADNSLRDIQRELRTRNQIETNRMVLDIAKFKYLNPGFNFHY